MTTKELAAIARGLAPAFRDAMTELRRSLTDRVEQVETQVKAFQAVPGPPGRDGTDGKDGRDGVNGDDVPEVLFDKETRTLTFRWTKGEKVVDRTVTVPVIIDRGVWKAGQTYHDGDSVSYQGSTWTAQDPDTTGQPGTTKAWRLSSKSGRDGRNGKDGAPGPQGPEGRPGRDLVQMDEHGNKWR